MQLQKQKVLVPNIFQYEALQKLEETNKSKGVVVMPTGTGKTFLASLWFKKQLETNPKAKLLFICHNKDILSQANEEEFQNCLKELDITFGYYNAEEKNIQQCTFATTQTLTRNLDKFPQDYFDYIIVDEAHHYQAKSFKKVLEYFKSSFLLGLTATPSRMDGKNIYEICGNKLYEARISDAIKKGILTKIKYYCVDNDIDFSDVKWNGNKYDEKDLNRKMCVKEYDEAIIKEYNETVKGKFNRTKTICFCATVEHAHRMSKLFNGKGISAIALTGKYHSKETRVTIHRGKREQIIKDFKEGAYEIIFVRDLFNEGVDIPDTDCVMMLRPTQSHTIFTQQIGRGLRTSENKKDVLILDFTGNARKCVINFEVLGGMIDLDIVKKIKSGNYEGRNEIVILSNGCEVRLNKMKINVLMQIRRIPTKEELIMEFRNLKKKLGRTPRAREVRSCAYQHRVYWGSWNGFLKMMKEEVILNYEKVNKEELIKQYYNAKNKLGRQPLQKEFASNIKYGYHYNLKKYSRHFGSWTKFLREIDEPLNQNNVFAKDVSKEDLINNYKDLKKKLKKTITSEDIRIKKGSKYGLNKYSSKFGSWTSFLKEINEPYRQLYIPKEYLIEELKKIKKKLGRIPTIKEFSNNSKYCYITVKQHFGSWEDTLKEVFGEDCNYRFRSIDKKINCEVCEKEVIFRKSGDYKDKDKKYCSLKCANIARCKVIKDFTNRFTKEEMFKEYKRIKKLLKRTPKQTDFVGYNKLSKFSMSPIEYKFGRFGKFKCGAEEWLKQKSNIKITSDYKPKTIIIPIKKNRKGLKKAYEGWHKEEYKSKVDKVDIRKKIISNIKDGDTILLLESPDLSAIKEIEKQDKKPNKIIIPNHLEFNKLVDAIQNYKTDLNIEIVNTSVLQYLVDSEEKFDFIWLDYCGAFSYYMKDLDILFQKHLNNMKLILTYNLFDPAKEDENYYFTRVIDYVLGKNEDKKVRLINDVSYRYKKNMYNLGFNISKLEARA